MIPPEIRVLVAMYRTRQWHLLSFLARCGEAAADLTRSSPALAFALASNWVFHKPAVKRPLRSARGLLRRGKNQKDVLDWLGFPPTKSVRRLLTRIVPASINVCPLLYLRDALHHPEQAARLAHVARLNAGVLRIQTDRQLAPHVSPRLLEELSRRSEEDVVPHSAYLLRDTLNMHTQVFPDRRFPQLQSWQRLNEIHDELTRTYHTRRPESFTFPTPPLQGNDRIVPILNSQDLWREGVEMNHCVGSYSRQIATAKNVFVYKVLNPERCTLSIQRTGSRWRIAELKKASNRQADEGTRKLVTSWLSSSEPNTLGA